jgi:hypothetical protein
MEKANEKEKKLYFICNTDSYGQRTGTYKRVYLSDDEIETDHRGWKFHKGVFLYDSEMGVLYACQD